MATTDPDPAAMLRLAGAVEADSEHPLARAVVAAARERGEPPKATGFRALTGRGVQATVDGAAVAVGGPALLRRLELAEPEALAAELDGWRARGAAVLYVVRDDKVVGRCRWMTRSVPSPARRLTSCTASASGW